MELVNREDLDNAEEKEDIFTVPEPEEDDEVFTDDEEEEEVKDCGTFTLSSPIEIDGALVKKLHYDFTTMKPVQYINIVKRVGKKENVQVPELNMSVQFNVFCRAAGVPVAILKTEVQRVDEFTAMCQLARDFLLSKQGETDEVL